MLVVLVALAITAGPAATAGSATTTPTTTSANPHPSPPHTHRARRRHATAHTAQHKSKRTAVRNTPQEAVQRFLEPRTPAEACAQLSHPFMKRVARPYGSCLVAVKRNPKVADLVISNVVVNGKNATLKTTYRVPAGRGATYFSLTRIKDTWRISGAR
jgi:hypothetical protein